MRDALHFEWPRTPKETKSTVRNATQHTHANNDTQRRKFNVHVMGVHKPIRKGGALTSAAAWQVREQGALEPEAPRAITSKSPKSDNWRATVAAGTGALADIPAGSVVTIFTRSEPFADAVKPGSTRKAADEWWAQFEAERRRHVSVTAVFMQSDDEVFVTLRKMANDAIANGDA